MDSPKPSSSAQDKKTKSSGGMEWWWILLIVFVVFFFLVIGFFLVRSILNSKTSNANTNVIKNIRVNNVRTQ